MCAYREREREREREETREEREKHRERKKVLTNLLSHLPTVETFYWFAQASDGWKDLLSDIPLHVKPEEIDRLDR